MSWINPIVKVWNDSNSKAFGLYRESELAAFMMARSNYFVFKGKHFPLDSNESYLENMYTLENFRGRNLAPYLRYQCYKLLAAEGKTVCYSITQYFNKSSLKFKSKLNVQHVELWLHLGLFKKIKWNFLIKKYSPLNKVTT